jgi:trimeric autotransporter adhesin
VTLLDTDGHVDTATTSANPQSVAADTAYTFSGLTAGAAYRLETVRSGKVINTADCIAALAAVQQNRAAVDAANARIDPAVNTLSQAIARLQSGATSSGPSGAPSSSAPSSGVPSRSAPSRSAPSSSASAGFTPTGESNENVPSGTSTTTTSAQQLVADQKSIDAARAQLRVARSDRDMAVLRAPIDGTVADLKISTGDSVSSATTAMTIVGKGRKSVVVNVSLADIDLVRVSDRAHVTVDGLSTPLPARVAQIGLTNTASSTGSSSTYAVTVVLDKTAARLYDGMGATLAIDVGSARNVVTVPTSAIATIGSLHTVRVYSAGKLTTTAVTLGVQGADRVQVKSGLRAGQRVVLAEVSAAIPSSDSVQRTFGRGGGGLTTGFTGGFGGRAPSR